MALQERFSIASQMVEGFSLKGWPSTVLITGQRTAAKKEFINNLVASELYKNRLNHDITEESFYRLMRAGEHPDFIVFSADRIKIGNEKKPEENTIRHLLNKTLPYRPRNATVRIVYFQNAALIRDEAESALLKTLEEPRDDTRFILSVDDASMMKDTIVSRSILVPFIEKTDPEKVSPDPWVRYFYLSRENENEVFPILDEKGLVNQMQQLYDRLNFDIGDYQVFEELAILCLNSFAKETSDIRLGILCFLFRPLYFSIRDSLLEGTSATIGPVRIAVEYKARLLALARIIEGLFEASSQRYFGTRAPGQNALIYGFLSRLIKAWPKERASAASH